MRPTILMVNLPDPIFISFAPTSYLSLFPNAMIIKITYTLQLAAAGR
jgi:hypothetical protein